MYRPPMHSNGLSHGLVAPFTNMTQKLASLLDPGRPGIANRDQFDS